MSVRVEVRGHVLHAYGYWDCGAYYVREIWMEHSRPRGTSRISWERRLCRKVEEALISSQDFDEAVLESAREAARERD